LPEKLEAMLESATGGAKKVVKNAIDYLKKRKRPLTVSEIAKERLRLVGAQLKKRGNLDIGFRSFKLSPSAFTKWDVDSNASPSDLLSHIEAHTSHLDDLSSEDILFELLLKDGFELTTSIDEMVAAGSKVYSIADGTLLVCLERNLTKGIIDALADLAAEKEAGRVICLDAGFHGNDQLKANAVQTFKSRLGHGEDGSMFRTV
jgi:adenine-specific DNA-methyltransferase